MAKVKLALVGLGSIAVGQYLPQIAGNRRTPRSSPSATCARTGPASRRSASASPASSPTSTQMLADAPFDALVNTASIPAHFPLNLQALQAGKHVYSQKPFATHRGGGDDLIDEAARRGLKMSVSPIHMLRPEVQEMRRLVQGGALGKVSLVRCRSSHGGPEYFQYRDADPTWFFQEGGGPLLDMGVHGLHQVTGILGPARSVTCLSGVSETVRIVRSGAFDGKEIRPEVDDNTLIMLDFGEATFAVVDSSYCVKAARGPGLEIFGSAGSIVGRPPGERRRPPVRGLPGRPRRRRCGAGSRPSCACPGCARRSASLDLVEAIREDRRPVLTPEHARHVIEIMNTCLPAAREGRTIPLQTTF